MNPRALQRTSETYWQQNAGNIFVSKASGTVFHRDNPGLGIKLLSTIAAFRKHGIQNVLVHGGGKQLDEIMAADAPKNKVTQLRMTPKRLISAVERERQAVSDQIASLCQEIDLPCEILPPSVVRAERILGHGETGRVRHIVREKIEDVLRQGKLAIVPFGGVVDSEEGEEYLNVNADEDAAEIARALGAAKLIYVTNEDGIQRPSRNGNGGSRRISYLDYSAATRLLREQDDQGRFIISAGMLPKLEMAMRAVAGGVSQVHLVPAKTGHEVLDEVLQLTGSDFGTLIEYLQSVEVVQAEPQDLDEIIGLREDCSAPESSTPNGTPYLRPLPRNEISRQLPNTIVIKHRGIVVGSISCENVIDHPRTMKIGGFAVGENHQESQYGRELFEQMLDRLAKDSIRAGSCYDEAISITAAPGVAHLFAHYGRADTEGKYAGELAAARKRYGTDADQVQLFVFDLNGRR
jgi:acetylglutamate kinase